MVVSNGESVGWVSVNQVDLGILGGEDCLAGIEFLDGGVGKVVCGNVGNEIEIDGGEHFEVLRLSNI